MARIFLICPVRNITQEVEAKIRTYVTHCEVAGHAVHWPMRDTDQNDPVGMRICRDNGHAILRADEIHVWYHPASIGSVFDLGMTFMLLEVIKLHKRVVIANPEDVDATDAKSFPNVLTALAERHCKPQS